jgi:alpha-glucosidase
MDDVIEMINQAHDRDIRVIFDLVPNHTSDQSEWFEASSSPDHPDFERYKDYYIWHDPVAGELPKNIVSGDRVDGLPEGLTVPNNWSSIFSIPQIDNMRERHGGEIPSGIDVPALTAWVWNEKRQQFYLAEFMKQQPTLNWTNPVVREQIKNVVRFWLDLGVDSFRVDAMNHIAKDTTLQDEDPTTGGWYTPGQTNPHDQWKQEKMVNHWPELGEYAGELISVLDEPEYQGRNIRLIFEDWINDGKLDNLRPDKANVFNFETLVHTSRERWVAKNIGNIIQGYYARMKELHGAAPNQVTGNHDTDTLRTRLGSAMSARAAHLMLAALPGSLYTWQGDMMGRPNVIVPPNLQQDGDIGKRDAERVPMQWNATKNGGFSDAESDQLWLPSVDPSIYQTDNIELQARDPNSHYRLVRDIFNCRLSDTALHDGGICMLHTDHPDVLAFARDDPENPRRQVISITNFTQDTVSVSVLDAMQSRGRITLSSTGSGMRVDTDLDFSQPIVLSPDESCLIDSLP